MRTAVGGVEGDEGVVALLAQLARPGVDLPRLQLRLRLRPPRLHQLPVHCAMGSGGATDRGRGKSQWSEQWAKHQRFFNFL